MPPITRSTPEDTSSLMCNPEDLKATMNANKQDSQTSPGGNTEEAGLSYGCTTSASHAKSSCARTRLKQGVSLGAE